MNPKKIWCNLGVEDLERTTQFYTRLGFKFNGRADDLTSFFFGENDLIIHFFKKSVLREAMKGEMADTQSVNEIIFTLSAGSRAEADNWAIEIKNAGGTLISQPEAFGQDYYGFVFADPDGHRFNVFYM
ncbi:MAG: VOC family protein [Bacteroidetes bacterium]|nr:VOC family protein [Bacteroidota bacterium]